ncbi:MAG: EAL domain-containing protein [Woeseiaceae bacterium]|nr:EAL domain-containing protein [Woeseiaceae bacterium]
MSTQPDSRAASHILIADDDATTRIIARRVLERAGFVVSEAADGREAIERYLAARPDVVLLDVDMPGLDGFEVCERIRNGPVNPQTPILIATGLDDDSSVEQAYDRGATDFVAKPVTWSALPHRVRYVLRASEAFNDMAGLLGALPDTILVLDAAGEIADSTSGLGAIGADEEFETAMAAMADLAGGAKRQTLVRRIATVIEEGRSQLLEHHYEAAKVDFEIRIVPRDRHTVLAILRDSTDRKRYENRIYDLAFFDLLTGLPNRSSFASELDGIIEAQHDPAFAILFVDLDRFKRINDTMGHSIGDQLLEDVAKRLGECTRSGDALTKADADEVSGVKLARLGGDEFVILLRDVHTEKEAAAIAERVLRALSQPFTCEGHQFVITPSIGIALYPQDGASRDELLMNADSAMYRAKAAGRNNYKFYSETMRIRSLKRLDTEIELRRAIDNRDFELYFQPKVELSTWTIVGAEALLRWHHADRGWISPTEFIGVAEESGLILQLGEWVLEAACHELRTWQANGMQDITLSVNVSSKQVYSDTLGKSVEEAVQRSGIDPERLELEITEGLLMRDVEQTIMTLDRMKALGLKLSVDDFGTGYSSLSYLKKFPIDILKIDQSFVRDLHTDADDAAICAAILAMGQKLGLAVVAEGVEIEEQLEFLHAHGCDQIQGYYFSKPLSAADLKAFVADYVGAGGHAAGL